MNLLLAAAEQGSGFHVPSVTELFNWVPLATFAIGPITFHISGLIIFLFASVLLTTGLFVAGFANAKMVPTGIQNFLEGGIGFVRTNVVHPTLGVEGEKWMPFLSTIFFFVFTLNLMEVIPGIQYPISSRMAFPALLAIISWLVFNYVGIKEQGFGTYFKGMLFPPGVPKPIYLILTPVEFLSTMVFRPLTLAVRLFANMMAGHVMLAIFFIASAYFLVHSEGVFLKILSPFPIVMSIALVGFEIFIGGIQAFIFTILTAVYIAGASHADH